MRTFNFFIILFFAAFIFSCKKTETASTAEKSETLSSIAENYYEDYLKLYPLEATAQGDYRYNDVLQNNISKEFISKEIAHYANYQKQLSAIDYKSLNDSDKTIYDVLDFTLKNKTEHLSQRPELMPFNQFEGLPLDFPLLGSGKGNQPFETEKDYDNFLKRIDGFEIWMNTAIANFKDGMQQNVVLPKKLVVKMIPQMNAKEITTPDFTKNIFFGPIQNFPKNFSAEQKTRYTELYKNAIEKKIIPSYLKMAQFLEQEYLPKARNTDGYNSLPNGENYYGFYVKSWTTTKNTPQEIHETGLKEVARIRSEMEKVKTQIGFTGSLEEFLSHVKSDPKAMPFKTSKEILDAFQAILDKISPKLETMFGNTPKTAFEIRQTEKFREASASAEYKQGTPDGKRPGIFYIPIPDATKFNVTSGMESLFLHEAIPGHHYQVSLQQENTNIPKFMRFGWFGAYGEGWALYTESLGPEFGLYTDPYQKMGALSDEMMRAVRLVVDTGLHTGKMNREQAIAYFLSNVAYDEASATAEIERYMAIPGQALSYKTGSLKIRELRTKYEKDLGENFNLAGFHDELLNQGCLPLSVLERKMDAWAKKQK